MACLGVEPGAAGWKAQMNPLSYGGTPTRNHSILLYFPNSSVLTQPWCQFVENILLSYSLSLSRYLTSILSLIDILFRFYIGAPNLILPLSHIHTHNHQCDQIKIAKCL